MKLQIFPTSIQFGVLFCALFFTATLKAQSSGQIASLDLPDAPSAQATVQTAPSVSSSQTPTTAVDEKEEKRLKYEQAERELQAQQRQRIAGVLPNFNTVLGGYAAPLSPGQKMRAAFRSAIDPAQFVIAGISAAYGQATDSHSSIDSTGFRHGYEQGGIGFVKRYGASYADQFDGTLLGNGVFPALLHQDARYFRLGEGTIKHRIVYAALTTVRCKGDNGKWQPNASNLLGNLAAGGISNLYYPAADRGFELTIQQGLVVTAEGAIGSFLLEFYPDIQKRFLHRKKQAAPVSTSQTVQP
ncbi:MAG: hypothetical protein JWM43_3628 [Acidobacteriaceae bacterium]|nr:hypothetical protein [Acidobacteriaceae bacterium]